MRAADSATDKNVGGKTPEEIKKSLVMCAQRTYGSSCRKCAYIQGDAGCIADLEEDALALIEQLEKRNNRLEYTLMGVMHSVDKWLKVEPYDFDKDDGTEAVTRAANAREIMLKAIEHLERERDAAIEDIKKAALFLCQTCKKYHPTNNGLVNKQYCDAIPADHFGDGAIACGMYEWRGVKEEKDEKA